MVDVHPAPVSVSSVKFDDRKSRIVSNDQETNSEPRVRNSSQNNCPTLKLPLYRIPVSQYFFRVQQQTAAKTTTEQQRTRKLRCFGGATGQTADTRPETTNKHNSNRQNPVLSSTTARYPTTTANNRRASPPAPPQSNLLWARISSGGAAAAHANAATPSLFQSPASSAGLLLKLGKAPTAKRSRARAPMATGWRAYLWQVWRGLMALEAWCQSNWGGRACAHVVAGALASSHTVVGSLVVGVAVWVSCAKRSSQGGKDSWKQVAR